VAVPTTDAPSALDPAVAVYLEQRPRLVRVAYRVLGDAAEADDVVQEVWLRWQRTDRDVVHNPAAFLATATSRLAINVRQAARTRHEAPGTPWLEDVAEPAAPLDLPEAAAERAEVAGLALRVLLERLTPAERAAYVLRNGLDYPYRRISSVLDLSTANARQLVSRAHRRLRSASPQPVSPEAHRRLVRAFLRASRAGEVAELEALLTADVARAQPLRSSL
jgi:RNA polymerase sigma-70 factor (ECF subfamily)